MHTLNCKGKLLVLDKPAVMGIINVTPDSFYAGSRKEDIDACLQQAEKMVKEGALILDIGGQSTRPGSKQVGAAEEAARVLPVIEAIANDFPAAIISVDTFHAAVAKQAVEAGAAMVNDVSGGFFDAAMLSTVAALQVPYICMHNRGLQEQMATNVVYEDLVKEVLDFFIERIGACNAEGINDLIIDPGFGFSKTPAHNFLLLRKLEVFKITGKPILLGVSRKSTIYKTLGITPEQALNGTTVLHTVGLLHGASILRVHDVREAVQAIQLLKAMR